LPRPYRTRSRVQRTALLALLRAAGTRLASRTVVVASRTQPELLSTFERLFPDRDVQVSVSAGTAGPMRKPTVAGFDRNGKALAFAKVAISPQSEALVHN